MFGQAQLLVQASLSLLVSAGYVQPPVEDFAARNLRTIQSIYNLTVRLANLGPKRRLERCVWDTGIWMPHAWETDCRSRYILIMLK